MDEPGTARFDWQAAYARLDAALRVVESSGERAPEDIARILEARARVFAARRAEPWTRGDVAALLVFTLGGERYAVEAGHVVEVVLLRGLAPVPGVPAFVAGIVHHRGRVFPVLDLVRFFGAAAEPDAATGRVVAVQARTATFGILAETVTGLVQAGADQLEPPLGEPAGATFLRGMAPGRIAVLDVEALAADPRLIVDQEAG